MTISVKDFQAAMRRSGMGAPAADLNPEDAFDANGNLPGDSGYDPSTSAYSTGTNVGPAATWNGSQWVGAGAIFDPTKSLADQTPVSQRAPAATSSGSSLADDIGSFLKVLTPVADFGLRAGGVLPNTPTPRPAPSKPLSTGTKVAIGLGIGIPVVGGLAYALWPKSRRRR